MFLTTMNEVSKIVDEKIVQTGKRLDRVLDRSRELNEVTGRVMAKDNMIYDQQTLETIVIWIENTLKVSRLHRGALKELREMLQACVEANEMPSQDATILFNNASLVAARLPGIEAEFDLTSQYYAKIETRLETLFEDGTPFDKDLFMLQGEIVEVGHSLKIALASVKQAGEEFETVLESFKQLQQPNNQG